MQYPFLSNNQQYLNRLSLTAGKQGIDDPYSVITGFFHVGNVAEMKKLFTATCNAALTEQYSWQQGCPGNLLYFYEQLEILVEACFLIYQDKKQKRRIARKLHRAFRKKQLQDIVLPSALSAAEIADPFFVVQSFFELYTLKQWKRWLYAWMEAGLSDYGVLESIKAKSILPYHLQVQKLLDACWYISIALKKKTK